jgi:hypothetical protein
LNWTRKLREDVIEAHQSTALGGSDAQTSNDAGIQIALFLAPVEMQPLSPDINRKIVPLLARLLRQHADRNTGAPSNAENRMSEKIKPHHLERS